MTNVGSYPRYKKTDIPWAGDIPEHWSVVPCRSVVENIAEKNHDGEVNNYLSLMANVGVIRYEDKGDIGNKKPDDLTKCKIVRKGQLVINSMNYAIGSYGMSPYDGVCSPVYIILQAKKNVLLERYGLRVFENTPFQKHLATFGNGILAHRAAIGWDDIKGQYIPLAPIIEQEKILQYLDHETAKIDTLIKKQQQLIKLLIEKRQAVISHAVTKGLNPEARMKDSGVDWLGEVPNGWTIVPLKYLVISKSGIQMGPFGGMLKDLEYTDTGYKLYGQENTISGDFRKGRRWVTKKRYEELSNYKLEESDIVLTRKGSLGKARQIKNLETPGLIDSDTIRVRVDSTLLMSEFLSLLMHEAHYIAEQITRTRRGSVLPGLNTETISNLKIVLPSSKTQQEELVKEVIGVMKFYDNAIDECVFKSDLLQERRTALISAAVTGKIDVRNWQPTDSKKLEVIA